ncbi:hypothetical protein GTF03_18395 [Roseobacter sp. HKCCD7415]|nr:MULTISPECIES: hypothetical protein [unclassified Roseobacter]NNV48907.1 hypothetical protein [Roseobacter sp. HKCCD6265]NNV70171.1 hypothetical protein [Roseobacter sp. HKCCD8474]NNX49008.1 hypothetical protein [Roseobacter sp. HKCCD8429]NNX66114.1 hypothetical protein [Roseobacter sp. HKCCD8515]NNX74622.1 hypothetical protein [Roseobacter sp. HKCCD9065]NNY00158.1 hypothetical protein [Roseobacter sp. HKCCD9066]NNY51386.1 hypothetical protein [Roseobacter sp. HKCCD8190]NNY59924.1 hypothe
MVTSENELRVFLETQPQEVSVAIAYRATMRVLPFATRVDGFEGAPHLTLASLRAGLTSGVIAARSSRDVKLTACAAASGASIGLFFSGPVAGSIRGPSAIHLSARAASPAARAAARAALCAVDSGAVADAFRAADAAAVAAFPAGAVLTNDLAIVAADAAATTVFPADAVVACVAADVARVAANEMDSLRLAAFRIDLPAPLSNIVTPVTQSVDSALTIGGPWTFWAKWYDRAMAGDPLPWDLQEQIALIPDKVWEAGPEAVAEEIARIEAEFDLRQRIAELEVDQALIKEKRLGMGGNNPPIEIDDRETVEQVIVLWESIKGLKEEVDADEPDTERVAGLIDRIAAALRFIIAWCGRKADLMIDTTIKWGVPAAGGGYFFLNPAKAESVLKAAQAWLPFLAP